LSQLDDLEKYGKTPVVKPKASPCAEKTESIHEKLRKIKEQIDSITIVDLTPVLEELSGLKTALNTLITLMERKVEHDALEDTVLQLMKKDLEKR